MRLTSCVRFNIRPHRLRKGKVSFFSSSSAPSSSPSSSSSASAAVLSNSARVYASFSRSSASCSSQQLSSSITRLIPSRAYSTLDEVGEPGAELGSVKHQHARHHGADTGTSRSKQPAQGRDKAKDQSDPNGALSLLDQVDMSDQFFDDASSIGEHRMDGGDQDEEYEYEDIAVDEDAVADAGAEGEAASDAVERKTPKQKVMRKRRRKKRKNGGFQSLQKEDHAKSLKELSQNPNFLYEIGLGMSSRQFTSMIHW